ncbi:hypothetical protein ACHAWF_001213, partial [Thalassiosira exigua]
LRDVWGACQGRLRRGCIQPCVDIVVKELDKRKKARCTCDGSTRAGQVRVLDYTYANCIDNVSNRMFYALAAGEDLLVFGADVSNAFGEAPPPKQGFFIRPDKAFRQWWTQKLGRKPIPPGWVIPVLRAMQGHAEAPRLWEKYADAIMRCKKIGLVPTTHEPCLYSGLIEGEHVLFKRQVDDSEVAARTERTAIIIFDLIEEALTFPLKRMGLVTMFNGLDILQTRYFIKVSCETYINKISEGHIATWMRTRDIPNRPTPLPMAPTFLRAYLGAKGNPNAKHQEALAKEMGFEYRSNIGQLIYPYITCRPDIAFATEHFHGVCHTLKYLYATKDHVIYFWHPQANMLLPDVPPPRINSNLHDLLHDGRPTHGPLEAATWVDSDWAGCLQTRRSFEGT